MSWYSLDVFPQDPERRGIHWFGTFGAVKLKDVETHMEEVNQKWRGEFDLWVRVRGGKIKTREYVIRKWEPAPRNEDVAVATAIPQPTTELVTDPIVAAQLAATMELKGIRAAQREENAPVLAFLKGEDDMPPPPMPVEEPPAPPAIEDDDLPPPPPKRTRKKKAA